MKSRAPFLIAGLLFAAILSSVSTVLIIRPDLISGPAPAQAQPTVFSKLVVLDNSRESLSFEEQKALFEGLADQLREPPSAQLRRLKRSTISKSGICGEINSKNGFGGYVGFVPFEAQFDMNEKAHLLIPTQKEIEDAPDSVARILEGLGC